MKNPQVTSGRTLDRLYTKCLHRHHMCLQGSWRKLRVPQVMSVLVGKSYTGLLQRLRTRCYKDRCCCLGLAAANWHNTAVIVNAIPGTIVVPAIHAGSVHERIPVYRTYVLYLVLHVQTAASRGASTDHALSAHLRHCPQLVTSGPPPRAPPDPLALTCPPPCGTPCIGSFGAGVGKGLPPRTPCIGSFGAGAGRCPPPRTPCTGVMVHCRHNTAVIVNASPGTMEHALTITEFERSRARSTSIRHTVVTYCVVTTSRCQIRMYNP